MQPAPGVADPLDELPFDEAVHVLVRTIDEGGIAAAGIEDLLQTAADRAGVLTGEHPRRRKRIGPRETAGHVVFEERAVEPEGDAEVERIRIRCGIETPRPESHLNSEC